MKLLGGFSSVTMNLASQMMRLKEFVSLDFTGPTLKMALLMSSPGKEEIKSLVRHDIRGRSDEEIAEIIRDALKGVRLKNRTIISIIPSHQAITKNIEIPSVNPQEIDDIVRLQAGRHTPYARDEIVVDYINLGVYGSNYTKILLVIVKREVVKRQYTLLEMAGARLDRIALIPEAIGAVALPVLKVDSMDAPVAILHVDTEMTDFTAIRSEKTIFLRCIRVGSMHLGLEREKYQIMFIEEVKKSLEAYQGEDVGQPPHKFIVTGVLSDAVKDLCPILGDALHIPTRAQPFVEQVPFSKQAARIASTVKDLSFLTCIAPLLVLDRLKINLLPEEVKVRRAFEKRSKALIQMGVLAMTLFILLFSVFFSRVVFKRLYLERLTAMYLPLNEEATLLEREYANVRTVHAFLIERHLPLEALTRLHELIPDGVYLTQIKYDETTGLSIKGSAMTMTEVFVSVDGMEKSEWFSNVQTRYTTKRKEGDFDVTDFEITCVTETSG